MKNIRPTRTSEGWPRRGDEGGFTLIELLIAMVLLVLLSIALYGTFFSVMRGTTAVRERGEPLRDARITLDMLRRELSSVYFAKGKERFRFLVEDRDVFGMHASVLEFSCFTVPASGSVPSSDIMRARYEPLEQAGDKIILTRRTRDVFVEGKPVSYPLTGIIDGFLVECYDGESWVKSWDTELNGKLPGAIRVSVFLPGEDEKTPLTAVIIPRMAGS